VAEALAQLHSGSKTNAYAVMHRDLKPANVGFDAKNDQIKLMDFGLVCAVSKEEEKAEKGTKGEKEGSSQKQQVSGKVMRKVGGWFGGGADNEKEKRSPQEKDKDKEKVEEETKKDVKKRFPVAKTAGGQMLYDLTGNTGSTRYMAPEVALGLTYNTSCEVYSWAVLCWQLVEQKLPYSGMNVEMMSVQVFNSPYKRNPLSPELWPYGLDRLLTSAWGHEVDKRPSMAVVVQVLRKALKEEEKQGPSNRTRSNPIFSCCTAHKAVAEQDLTDGLL